MFQPELTEAQQAAYLKSPHACPRCHSVDITHDSVNYESGTWFQEVTCDDCGFIWTDVYTLTGVWTSYDREESTSIVREPSSRLMPVNRTEDFYSEHEDADGKAFLLRWEKADSIGSTWAAVDDELPMGECYDTRGGGLPTDNDLDLATEAALIERKRRYFGTALYTSFTKEEVEA